METELENRLKEAEAKIANLTASLQDTEHKLSLKEFKV
jgi:hypothetical protein